MNKKRENKEFDRSFKLLIKSSVIVFIGIFLSKLLTYLYRIIVARYYGPEVYGLFSLSILIIGWFILISNIGLNKGILRYIPLYRGKKQKDRISYIFKTTRFWTSLASILAGIVLYFLAPVFAGPVFQNQGLLVFLRIFSIVIPLAVILSIYLSALRAYEKIGWFIFISNILESFVKLIIIIILIYVGVNSESVAISYTAGMGLTLIVTYFVAKIVIPDLFKSTKTNKKQNKKAFLDMLSYSWPLMFFGIIAPIFYSIDSFVIGIFSNVQDVGFYNAAIAIAFLLTIFKDLFMQLFSPLVTREYSQGNMGIVRDLSKQVGKMIFLISLPVFILILFFPGAFINILFGSEYLVAANSLRILIIGVLFLTVFDISKELLLVKGKSGLVLTNIIIASVVNLILNLILVPKYGIDGAAIATTISISLLYLAFLVQSRYYLGVMPIKRKMIRIIITGLISIIPLFLIRSYVSLNLLGLIFLASFFLLFYIILIFATKCLDRNDMLVVDSLRAKLLNIENTLKPRYGKNKSKNI